MFRALTCLLVSGVVSLAACGDDGTSPEDELTAAEVEFLASQIDATFAGVFDDFFDQTGGDPSNAPALTDVPVVWTRTFERSRPCHNGGTLMVTGKGFTTWDAQAMTNDVSSFRDQDPRVLRLQASRRCGHHAKRQRHLDA